MISRMKEAHRNCLSTATKNDDTHQSLIWLVERPFTFFITDYTKIGSFGRNKWEGLFNRLLSKLLFPLWHNYYWQTIVNKILTDIERLYLSKLITQQHKKASFHEIQRYSGTLKKLLFEPHKAYRHLTFTDLFKFISETLHILASHLNLHHDYFLNEKTNQNNVCLTIYNRIRKEIMNHPYALDIACLLAIRANCIDCVEADIDHFLKSFPQEINDYLDDFKTLKDDLYTHPFFQIDRLKSLIKGSPKTILYELDNNGECLFDLLFIECLLKKGTRIFLTAKEKPILNDVTFYELKEMLSDPHFDHLKPYTSSQQLTLISSGSTIAGKDILNISADYKHAYKAADFIILKGQGNFQTMPICYQNHLRFKPIPYKKPLVFMMTIKSNLTYYTLKCILKTTKPPLKGSLFLYIFDSKEKSYYS